MTDRSRQAREISQYVQRLEEEGITPRYLSQIRSTLRSFREHCRENGANTTKTVSPDIIWSFLKRYEGMSFSHQRTTASILRTYLVSFGNPSMLKMKLRFRGYGRTRVDWLSPEEIEQVFRTPMTPQQTLLIGAGLLQGLRRVETLRLSVRDAQEALRTQVLRVRGKGLKERGVPLHADFAVILSSFLVWRDPSSELVALLPFGRTTSEKILREFCSRFGKRFGFHTMRRSFGRALWLLGVPIETIAELYGHSSVDMTRRYLGIALGDMQRALASYRIPTIVPPQIRPAL
jgi:integrase